MTNAETYGGTPIPDPDPTGEYPDGWHEISPARFAGSVGRREELVALYEKEVGERGYSAYEISLLVQGFIVGTTRTVAPGDNRSCVGVYGPDMLPCERHWLHPGVCGPKFHDPIQVPRQERMGQLDLRAGGLVRWRDG